jgi:choice-of-anchor C domain-containing protein
MLELSPPARPFFQTPSGRSRRSGASGSTDIIGWLVTGGGVDLLEDPWDVSNGTRAIDLDGGSPGGIQQTFATQVGQWYAVSFDLSGNPGNGTFGTGLPLIKQVQVTAGDFVGDYSFDSSGQSIDALVWQKILFSFVAVDTRSTLSFVSLSPAGTAYGALIDNVHVSTTSAPEPTPEPATLALMAVGTAAAGIRRRFRGDVK